MCDVGGENPGSRSAYERPVAQYMYDARGKEGGEGGRVTAQFGCFLTDEADPYDCLQNENENGFVLVFVLDRSLLLSNLNSALETAGAKIISWWV